MESFVLQYTGSAKSGFCSLFPQAVIDAEDVDDDSEKADDEDSEDDDDGNLGDERYTPAPVSSASRKPSLSARSSKAGDDESLYASLDETAISTSLPAQPAVGAVNVMSSGGVSGSPAGGNTPSKAKKESKKYYNTEGLVPRPGGGGASAGAAQAVGGSSRYYNLKPGSVSSAPRFPGARSPAPRSSGFPDDPATSVGGNANYVNAASSSKNQYEKPRFRGKQHHVYTSLKVGGGAAASRDASPKEDTTASDEPYYIQATVTRVSRGDVHPQPDGSVSGKNDGRSAVGRESSRAGRTSSSHVTVGSPNRNSGSSGTVRRDSERGASSKREAALTPAERESGHTSAAKKDSERSAVARRESASTPSGKGSSSHAPAERESGHTSAAKRDSQRSASARRDSPAGKRDSERHSGHSDTRTPVSRQGSNPAGHSNVAPKVDIDGYLLPVTPRRQ